MWERGETERSHVGRACFKVAKGEEKQPDSVRPAAYLAQELWAVPQSASPAYSNIYDNFLAGESN